MSFEATYVLPSDLMSDFGPEQQPHDARTADPKEENHKLTPAGAWHSSQAKLIPNCSGATEAADMTGRRQAQTGSPPPRDDDHHELPHIS